MAYRGLSLYLNGFIASVYTELNAVSKGTSLGIFTKDDDRGVEAAKDGSQPYIEMRDKPETCVFLELCTSLTSTRALGARVPSGIFKFQMPCHGATVE